MEIAMIITVLLFITLAIWGIADGLVVRNRIEFKKELDDYKELFNDERSKRRELEARVLSLTEEIDDLVKQKKSYETLSEYRLTRNIDLKLEIDNLNRRLEGAAKRLVKERELKKTLLKEKSALSKQTSLPPPGPDSSYI